MCRLIGSTLAEQALFDAMAEMALVAAVAV